MGRRTCGLIVFRRFDGTIEYLLLQKSHGKKGWTPPKGRVEEEETDFQTAVRETEEEVGFERNDLKIYEEVKHEMELPRKEKQKKTVIYWLAELINKNVVVRISKEHRDFKWVPINKACDLVSHTELKNALKDCDKYISESISKTN